MCQQQPRCLTGHPSEGSAQPPRPGLTSSAWRCRCSRAPEWAAPASRASPGGGQRGEGKSRSDHIPLLRCPSLTSGPTPTGLACPALPPTHSVWGDAALVPRPGSSACEPGLSCGSSPTPPAPPTPPRQLQSASTSHPALRITGQRQLRSVPQGARLAPPRPACPVASASPEQTQAPPLAINNLLCSNEL